MLHTIAHDPINPIPVITSIHQPRYVESLLSTLYSADFLSSSQLYQKFDTILLLSHGRVLYAGRGSLAPAEYFSSLAGQKGVVVPACPPGYNIADYLLEIASDPPVGLFSLRPEYDMAVATSSVNVLQSEKNGIIPTDDYTERQLNIPPTVDGLVSHNVLKESGCATSFLTQLQVLSGREWKILKRYLSLSLM